MAAGRAERSATPGHAADARWRTHCSVPDRRRVSRATRCTQDWRPRPRRNSRSRGPGAPRGGASPADLGGALGAPHRSRARSTARRPSRLEQTRATCRLRELVAGRALRRRHRNGCRAHITRGFGQGADRRFKLPSRRLRQPGARWAQLHELRRARPALEPWVTANRAGITGSF